MAEADSEKKRDLTQGIPSSELAADTMIHGRVGDEEVLVVKRGAEVFAIGAHCTHYRGPIAEGLVVGEDPELDAKRFFRSDGGVVLISGDMLAAL